ncbi:MAG: menaquinone biosynthesis protein [Bacteroidales bacterium]|nr:menaquinone biosynthesis protein [Bacteroidales bacterium]
MSKNKYRIGLVNFLNSYPFRYGLEQKKIDFQTAVPSLIAKGLADHKLDIGLVPVAAFHDNAQWNRITNFGIASSKKVKTVLLCASKPLDEIVSIQADSDSLTSNRLCHVIFNSFLNRKIVWDNSNNVDAMVRIGDKAFELDARFPYVYDMAELWKNHTNLPFVFAVWAANKELEADFIDEFNLALEFGIENIAESVKKYQNLIDISPAEAVDYLTANIQHSLDEDCIKSMDLFRKLSDLL